MYNLLQMGIMQTHCLDFSTLHTCQLMQLACSSRELPKFFIVALSVILDSYWQ